MNSNSLEKDPFFQHHDPDGGDNDAVSTPINDGDVSAFQHERYYHSQAVTTTASHPSAAGLSRSTRYLRRGKKKRGSASSYHGETNEDDDVLEQYDPTLGYVKRGMIVVPIEMTLPMASTDVLEDGFEEGLLLMGDEDDLLASIPDGHDEDNIEVDGHTSSETDTTSLPVDAAPSFSLKQCRITLYTAFPPPPVINRAAAYNKRELHNAKAKLKKHSGFHTAFGVTSATRHGEGYADTTVSLNYRLPTLVSTPTLVSSRNSSLFGYRLNNGHMVGNMHCNLHLGSHTKASVGGTLTSLDGRTNLYIDVGNPLAIIAEPDNRRYSKKGMLSPTSQSHYTIAATRDFFEVSNPPLRVNCMVKLSPLPPRVFVSEFENSGVAYSPLYLQNLSLVFTNYIKERRQQLAKKPKITLSLECVKPSVGVEHYFVPNAVSCDVPLQQDGMSCGQSPRSTSVKLDIEQQLSLSQSCHSFIGYRHAGNLLSFGTIFTRSFASSPFSRLGVGVSHAIENVFKPWWKTGAITWWLLQLERGSVRFVVPITFQPRALSTWDSAIRIFYSSLASIVVDAIVAELMCDTSSGCRIKFLEFILGKDVVQGQSTKANIASQENGQATEERWMQQHMSKAREDALTQTQLMMKQAKSIAKKEEEQGGLVILKAIYGVMDGKSRQWLRRADNGFNSAETKEWHTMEATTQLQFWVQSSSIHMSKVSTLKHMLGFYDVLACDGESERALPVAQSNEQSADKDTDTTVAESFKQWVRGLWNAEPEDQKQERDLVVVLSVRYKYDDKTYAVLFQEDETVDLPSQYAEPVAEDGS